MGPNDPGDVHNLVWSPSHSYGLGLETCFQLIENSMSDGVLL